MNTEQLTQVLETIKTFNLNIDSQTGKETIEILVAKLTPLLWGWLILDKVMSLIGIFAFILAVWLVSKAVMGYYKQKKEEENYDNN